LAFYTTRQSPKLVATLAHFRYVAFLALGLYEAAWIAKRLADAEAPTWGLFIVLGAALWLPAVGFVVYEFILRARDVPTLWGTR
jgi:ABC-type branched-subunit amino acid transport system permease subunit